MPKRRDPGPMMAGDLRKQKARAIAKSAVDKVTSSLGQSKQKRHRDVTLEIGKPTIMKAPRYDLSIGKITVSRTPKRRG